MTSYSQEYTPGYAAYVGFLQISLQLRQPRMQHEEFEAYVDHVMKTLIPS